MTTKRWFGASLLLAAMFHSAAAPAADSIAVRVPDVERVGERTYYREVECTKTVLVDVEILTRQERYVPCGMDACGRTIWRKVTEWCVTRKQQPKTVKFTVMKKSVEPFKYFVNAYVDSTTAAPAGACKPAAGQTAEKPVQAAASDCPAPAPASDGASPPPAPTADSEIVSPLQHVKAELTRLGEHVQRLDDRVKELAHGQPD